MIFFKFCQNSAQCLKSSLFNQKSIVQTDKTKQYGTWRMITTLTSIECLQVFKGWAQHFLCIVIYHLKQLCAVAAVMDPCSADEETETL